MPSYVSGVEEVLKYIPSLATRSGSTAPTDTEVLLAITQWEAYLNGVLRSAGYSTPLAETEDVATCALMVAQRAAVDVFTEAYEFDELPKQYQNMVDTWDKFISLISKGKFVFNAETPETDENPAFGIVRTPTRDDYFTNRHNLTDWDE